MRAADAPFRCSIELEEVADDTSGSRTSRRAKPISAVTIHRALAALPETHRIALTLRYFDALDYATIEQTLGLTNGALRGILGRALQTMRKRLQPALPQMRVTTWRTHARRFTDDIEHAGCAAGRVYAPRLLALPEDLR